MDDCIFCKITGGEIPSPRIYENDEVIAIDDIHPVAKVHVLIIPKAHYDNILCVDGGNAALLCAIQRAVREIARIKGIDGSGFRLISNCGKDGAQSVPHLHFHIVGGQRLGARIL